MTSTEYERGYLDGVAAASERVATFFQAHKDKDAKILRETMAMQEMVQKLMLGLLAPLQDQVRGLRPEENKND